jgi:lipid A 4'-phosphatase
VFLISLGLVHRRRQRRWAAVGVVAGLLIGFARIADVAHWLSDVLWAFPITLFTSWLVWRGLLLLYSKPSRTVG